MFKKAGYEFWLQATEKFSVKTILAIFKADGDETKIRETAKLIAQQLMSISSGSAAAVGNVDSITEIGMDGDLVGFSSLVDACDTQISYGLTGQTIATSKTEGGSLALGEVQSDLFYEDAKGIALEGQALVQRIVNWAMELNGYANIVPPAVEVDTERRASFDQVMDAIEHGVDVSKQALYDRYGLPQPRDEEDTFRKPQAAGFALSDSESKKKAPRRPQMKIL
jgi:phage gp29-like protein